MKDKLIIINKYKEFIELYFSYSLIYPRKYYYLKDMLENLLFQNLRELFIINSLSNKNVRVEKKEVLAGNLKYLNYLLTRVFSLEILKEKQYKVLYIRLEEIYKLLMGWLRSEG